MESLRGQEQQQESTTGSFNEAQGVEPSSSTPSSSGRSFASRHSRPSRSFYMTGQSSSFRASAPPQPVPLPSFVAEPRASISLNSQPAVVTSSAFTNKSGSFDACHRPACSMGPITDSTDAAACHDLAAAQSSNASGPRISLSHLEAVATSSADSAIDETRLAIDSTSAMSS